MSHNTPEHFHQQAKEALADKELRQNFRGAMDYLRGKRRDAFPDPAEEKAVRDRAEAIRQRCLSKLPELLEKLEQNLQRNGIQVHWAQNADEANEIFSALAKQHQAKLMVKGKSMVSEEIGLNHFMEKHGVRCLESDMGEYIVQLDGDTPSHIIMPAIHKNKQQVSDTFEHNISDFQPTTDVDRLIQTGRSALRKAYQEAEIGVSGVNFAVAETGTLCLVENEAMAACVPPSPRCMLPLPGLKKWWSSCQMFLPCTVPLPALPQVRTSRPIST